MATMLERFKRPSQAKPETARADAPAPAVARASKDTAKLLGRVIGGAVALTAGEAVAQEYDVAVPLDADDFFADTATATPGVRADQLRLAYIRASADLNRG